MEPKRYVTIQGLLVEGKKYTEDVETSVGTFQIRALSWGEKAEIQSASMAGIKTKTKADIFSEKAEQSGAEADVDIDFTVMQKQQWETKFKVLAYGLSVNKQRYTPDTVKKVSLSTTVFDLLHARILAISEVTPDELEPFREDQNGDSNIESNSNGSSSS